MNERIEKTLHNIISSKQNYLTRLFEKMPKPEQKLTNIQSIIIEANERMKAQIEKILLNSEQTVLRYGQLLDAFSFKRVLEKGFVLVTDREGNPVKQSQDAETGAYINLQFYDAKRQAQLDPDTLNTVDNKGDNSSEKPEISKQKENNKKNKIELQPKLL